MFRLCFLTVVLTSLKITIGRSGFRCADSEFECVSSETCIPASWKCDGEKDCQDGSDETTCVVPVTCQSGYYKCRNGRCIEPSWICDGHADCPEKDDEAPTQKCNRKTCRPDAFQCRNGDCIQGSFRCDNENDCDDQSDEADCPAPLCNAAQFRCADNESCISNGLRCNGMKDCTDGSDETGCPSCNNETHFMCANRECLPKSWHCDGQNDCVDHSDELGCPPAPTSATCGQNRFQCGNGDCIPLVWKCDGDPDCTDQTDEFDCPTHATCSSSQFTCAVSGKCILKEFRCNGITDCSDGSDESGCDSVISRCHEGSYHCAKSSLCIDMTRVCNNLRDCPEGDDEAKNCGIDECKDHNGHCHHNCTDLPIGYECSCGKGYKLMNDNRTCDDVDECDETYGVCSQTCVNLKGSYKCGCVDGYVEESASGMCKAKGPSPYLVFGDEHSVRNVSTSGRQYNVLVSNLKFPMAVDYDFESGYVYWTDILDERIERASLLGDGKVETLVNEVKHSNGLAVDWIGRKLYWTDETTKSIEVSELDGKNRLKLFSVSVDDPRGIAVDPFERYLFWTDWGSVHPKIERASMDGDSVTRQVILDTDIMWPVALTLDTIQQRVYFADNKMQKIETCKYDGSSRVKLVSAGLLHPMGLAVFEDYLYYTDYSLERIFSVNKRTGQVHGEIVSNLTRPTGVNVLHPLKQKKVYSKCSENNGGCSHLCLLSTNPQRYSCRCPEGMLPRGNGRTCLNFGKPTPATTEKTILKNDTTICDGNKGGCSHSCVPSADGKTYSCHCPDAMVLDDDQRTCVMQVNPTSTDGGTQITSTDGGTKITSTDGGTQTASTRRSTIGTSEGSMAKKSESPHSNRGRLIAGVTVAVAVGLFVLVLIVLYLRKRSRSSGRAILFYKDTSRTPLQNDFDEDPMKDQSEIAARSTVQFA